MKSFIEQEMQNIQAKLRMFNENGNRIQCIEDDKLLFETMADSLTVTRIAPHFAPDGSYTGADYWLFWKEIGYQEGFQYAHTIKVIHHKIEDSLVDAHNQSESWLSAVLTDDRGRRYRTEVIEPVSEPDFARKWREWRQFRESKADLFAGIDPVLLDEHLKIAGEWK